MGLIEVVITALGAILVGVVVGGLGQQAADEFKAWTPSIVKRLIRHSSRRLPKSLRSRMEEEWSAHAADVPGEVGKLACALGFLFASYRIKRPLAFRLSSPLFYSLGADRRVIGGVAAAVAPYIVNCPHLIGFSASQVEALVRKKVSLRHVVRLRMAGLYDLLHRDSVTWGSELGTIVAELLGEPFEKPGIDLTCKPKELPRA